VAAEVQPQIYKICGTPAGTSLGLEDMVVLKLVVQLLKRWRDVAYAKSIELAPISIVADNAGREFIPAGRVSERRPARHTGGNCFRNTRQRTLGCVNPSNPQRGPE